MAEKIRKEFDKFQDLLKDLLKVKPKDDKKKPKPKAKKPKMN